MGRAIVLHPDLGLGGAERLIVDASMALQDSGCPVTIYTGYHDRNRCFQETSDGRLNVIAIGNNIPRAIFGRFHALLAYLKMIYIAFYIILFTQNNYDLVLCDQVSACIPLFKIVQLFRKQIKIVFYCHFPDQLLTKRESLLKKIYRKPLDYFEEWSTSLADKIVVNSEFTSKTVKRTFRSFRDRDLTILYPCVNVEALSSSKPSMKSCSDHVKDCIKRTSDQEESFTFLSLNRFERKKDLGIAIQALQTLQLRLSHTTAGDLNRAKQVFLMVAGGYDQRLSENREYFEDLVEMTKSDEALTDQVMFIRSPSENEKLMLLKHCDAVIYTPENEHFGIVPIEAMAMSKPVVSSRSGGPLETIIEEGKGATGLLCEQTSESFAEAMLYLCQNKDLCKKLGSNGFQRVRSQFSYEIFRRRINQICFDAT